MNAINLVFGLAAIAVLAPIGFLITDSARGTEYEDSCVVTATIFSEAVRTTSYIDVGNSVTVQMTMEVPGAWTTQIKCDVAGVHEFALDEQPAVGQWFPLRYGRGRYSHSIATLSRPRIVN